MSKAIFQAHIEQIWNTKDASGIERFIAPNYRGFEAAEVISGIAGYKEHFVTLTTAFPDLRITIEVILEEALRDGDTRAGARFVVEATHSGPLGEIPPTGKPVRVTAIELIRARNRQIVEGHANADMLGLLTQIGITPEPAKVPPLIF